MSSQLYIFKRERRPREQVPFLISPSPCGNLRKIKFHIKKALMVILLSSLFFLVAEDSMSQTSLFLIQLRNFHLQRSQLLPDKS